jgi:hypothetical protein
MGTPLLSRRLSSVALWVIFLFGLLGSGCSALQKNAAFTGSSIRVGTYNVNYGSTTNALIETLKTLETDVLCLQETERFEETIRAELAVKYPYMLFRNSETRNVLVLRITSR